MRMRKFSPRLSSGATCVADLDSRALALTKQASGSSRVHVVPTCVAVGSRKADLAVAGVAVDAVNTHAELTGVAQALVVV